MMLGTNEMNLQARYGPWAVITGASEGTGSAFARELAAQGIASLLVARREAPLRALAAEIHAQSGVRCEILSQDLRAPDAADRIVAAVGAREVGLFIANAGADPNGARFLDRELAVWESLLAQTIGCTVRCTHHFANGMRQRGRGGVLLMGSGACYGGGSFMSMYAGAKAFGLCFAESLWAELRPQGVDVLYAALGRVDTPALRQLLQQKGLPVPDNLPEADIVARLSLAQLPHGPVYNYGQSDDETGFATSSAAARRQRVLMIDRASRSVFGQD